MRDRFVADVGDFGKYGLLRALCAKHGSDDALLLGIVWYFVPDRMIQYLDDRGRFEACDPELYQALQEIVGGCQRKVESVEYRNLFPVRTVFFREPVPTRLDMRRAWAQRAAAEMDGCDIVFLDPDNGIMRGPLRQGSISSQHAYYDDLEPLLSNNCSLVIYHHFRRLTREDRVAEVREYVSNLQQELNLAGPAWALVWNAYSPRAYFIVPNGREVVLGPRIQAILDGPWRQHFERID